MRAKPQREFILKVVVWDDMGYPVGPGRRGLENRTHEHFDEQLSLLLLYIIHLFNQFNIVLGSLIQTDFLQSAFAV